MAEFPIEQALDRVREAVAPYPKAAMFALAELGYATPFQQLVACIISIRTRDEQSLPISQRLFAAAATPAAIATLPVGDIERLITPSTFAATKAAQIQAIARRVSDEFAGDLPCDEVVLRSFAGVGIKCANLTLGVACGQPKISVDVHVHRIVNRWGYVQTSTPEQTTLALEAKLPHSYWIEINALLVPFGKHVCTGHAPRCSTCPVQPLCPQLGVTSHR